MSKFTNKLGDNPAIKTSLADFVKGSTKRNQDILMYNNSVLECYLQIKNRAMCERQAGDIGARLVGTARGLPAIVAFYQRMREESRSVLLRTLKHRRTSPCCSTSSTPSPPASAPSPCPSASRTARS